MADPIHSRPDEKTPIHFPHWADALQRDATSEAEGGQRRRAIITFLAYCKRERSPVSVAVAKMYLNTLSGPVAEEARDALRWFVMVGRREGNTGVRRPASSNLVPPAPAAQDTGGPDWEKALIQAIRRRGFLWRTEQTYRAWAGRFVEFIQPKSPMTAGGEELSAFLSWLATSKRSSPSSQKQALNALIFFLQEALRIQVGDLDFRRSAPKKRVPMVLSVPECRALFSKMHGTSRLMAELMYGAGLRLMELLRLRIHHLDLERAQLKVFGGKGDKDRMTMLPESLHPALREHLSRLRDLYEKDRQAGLPGVWIPEGLERKYQRAGEKWEWQWLFPSRELSKDRTTGIVRRHHVLDGTFQNMIRTAASAAGISKRVTPHVLRHSFGTHLMESGVDIRTVQDLMGHASVETTQIYLHVMKKPGVGVRSPLDGLGG